jgi:L-asparaginase/Glu-tRNA(Gln) amidotransferase subunit D
MTEVINHLRKRYTTVIISGPGVNRAVDLELVASRVDGIVLHAFGSQRIDPRASREVQHLMELGAPVLGVIG